MKEKIPWKVPSEEEIREIIKKLYFEGKTKSEIGMILRDTYGIPDVKAVTGKKIGEILKDLGIKEDIPEDLMNLIKKSVKLKEHMEKHKKDFKAKRAYEIVVSKIRRLVNYYKERKVLPESWTFTEEKAKLLAK